MYLGPETRRLPFRKLFLLWVLFWGICLLNDVISCLRRFIDMMMYWRAVYTSPITRKQTKEWQAIMKEKKR